MPRVAAPDGPEDRTGEAHAYQAGQEVLYGGKIYTILGISDNGLYLGRIRGGESVIDHYVSESEVRQTPW